MIQMMKLTDEELAEANITREDRAKEQAEVDAEIAAIRARGPSLTLTGFEMLTILGELRGLVADKALDEGREALADPAHLFLRDLENDALTRIETEGRKRIEAKEGS